ncbi:MAG TPA: hypothetical protein PLF88_14795 [Opitutaceae bacterium]|nr:hypothetical protein [Opitutaceae bacterium]
MNKKYVLPMILTIAAILCFVAGSPAYGFIPTKAANFSGLALILFSGLAWALAGGKGSDKKTGN